MKMCAKYSYRHSAVVVSFIILVYMDKVSDKLRWTLKNFPTILHFSLTRINVRFGLCYCLAFCWSEIETHSSDI